MISRRAIFRGATVVLVWLRPIGGAPRSHPNTAELLPGGRTTAHPSGNIRLMQSGQMPCEKRAAVCLDT